MSEVGERLAIIETNQKNADKRLDKLVSVVETIAKTQADIAVIQNDVNQIKINQRDLTAKVSQIEKNSLQNRMQIATISATVTSMIGAGIWYIKTKFK